MPSHELDLHLCPLKGHPLDFRDDFSEVVFFAMVADALPADEADLLRYLHDLLDLLCDLERPRFDPVRVRADGDMARGSDLTRESPVLP